MHIEKNKDTHRKSFIYLLVLLAASAQNKCTALVCSCYVPSRNFNSTTERNNSRNGRFHEESSKQQFQENNCNNGSCNNSSNGGSNNLPQHLEPSCSLKSNLKKICTEEENQSKKTEKRKVSWPDHALGKDIALVHEFEPSMFEDGELEGVRNSCICNIQ